eukprot:COSAG01_NODE_3700_length_5780_cov_207.494631_9_plen_146_part_00
MAVVLPKAQLRRHATPDPRTALSEGSRRENLCAVEAGWLAVAQQLARTSFASATLSSLSRFSSIVPSATSRECSIASGEEPSWLTSISTGHGPAASLPLACICWPGHKSAAKILTAESAAPFGTRKTMSKCGKCWRGVSPVAADV